MIDAPLLMTLAFVDADADIPQDAGVDGETTVVIESPRPELDRLHPLYGIPTPPSERGCQCDVTSADDPFGGALVVMVVGGALVLRREKRHKPK